MTKNLLPNPKVRHGSYPGSIRLDERSRNPLPRSPILIAPRPFVYDALQPGCIRLMKINPSGDRGSPIRAALKQHSLHHATYKALSCVLETEEPRETFYLNEQPMKIGSSLLHALRDIREEIDNTFIWVESICINQKDREEKEQQRIWMKEIERQATGIITWPREYPVKRRASDDATADDWMSAGKTSRPQAWNPALLRVDRSHSSSDAMNYQLFSQSPPALMYSSESPLTKSSSSSPDSNADFHLEQTSTLESPPFHLKSPYLWTFNMEDFDLQQMELSEETVMGATNAYQRKRSPMTAFPVESSAPYDQKAQKTKSTGTSSLERGSSVAFACPFQKADPQKHHKCLKYTLNRIKDVKQHIYRQHSKPNLYCARCYEVFSSVGDRDVHSRRADCETRDQPEFEGISEQQRNDLKKSSPKRKPLLEQWFEVWDLLFPDLQRPQSAVIGNYIEEMAPLLRNVWNQKKVEIISGVVDSRCGGNRVDSELLSEIMDSVFDRFEEETARSPQRSNTEWSEPHTDSCQDPSRTEADITEPDPCMDLEAVFDQQESLEMGPHAFGTGCDYYYASQSVEALFAPNFAH